MYVCMQFASNPRKMSARPEKAKGTNDICIEVWLQFFLSRSKCVYVTESDACHINRAQLVTRPAFSYVHNTKAKQRSCQSKREPCARQWYAQVTANSSFDKKKRIDSRSWCKAIISDTSSTHQNPKTDSTRSPKRPSPNLSEK